MEKTWEEKQVEGRIERDRWAAERGLKLSDGKCCIRRLWGRCRRGFQFVGSEKCPCGAPHDDHTSLWIRRGPQPVCWVSQPYQLSKAQRAEIQAFAAEHGLRVTISDWPSWHNPGSVLTVTYWRAGVPEFEE